MTGAASTALRPAAVRSGHPGPGAARLPYPAADRGLGGGPFAAGLPAAGGCAALPQVASAYAAYLYARTGVVPGTFADAGQAHVSVRTQGRLLLLTFRCRSGHGQEWALSSAEIRWDGRVTAFATGQLRRMVTALLAHESCQRC